MIDNIKLWLRNTRIKIRCFFSGHKYDYQLGWGKKGGYDDFWFYCSRCDKKFCHFKKSEIDAWK